MCCWSEAQVQAIAWGGHAHRNVWGTGGKGGGGGLKHFSRSIPGLSSTNRTQQHLRPPVGSCPQKHRQSAPNPTNSPSNRRQLCIVYPQAIPHPQPPSGIHRLPTNCLCLGSPGGLCLPKAKDPKLSWGADLQASKPRFIPTHACDNTLCTELRQSSLPLNALCCQALPTPTRAAASAPFGLPCPFYLL